MRWRKRSAAPTEFTIFALQYLNSQYDIARAKHFFLNFADDNLASAFFGAS